MNTTLPSLSIVHTFIALQLAGGIGMALILITTLFSSSAKRNGTWHSFCISWIVSALSYCLLFFAGQQTVYDKETPSYGLCLTQAALIYSTPPTTGATTFALFLDVYWKINTALSGGPIPSSSSHWILYIVPYILWIILTISFLVFGHVFPMTVQRDIANTYCVLNSTVPPVLTSVLVSIFALMVLTVLGTLFYRLKKSRSEQFAGFRNNRYLNAFFIRLILFMILGIIATCIGLVYAFNRTPGPQYDIAMAT
ncbi:hypothetical protein K435DRAFT_201315 [Dendrothele bispora CBS 962.96]|uniref:G-protein coupled receptors family 2 profile 2 domain-containing protein n=1 Tax=Dendrothele bispora (strain CBS 962.96) TaxID=1314807 RepID=A0A4S8KKC8_DENBC|nr:hypothetical protein K435DRAFT_201315 [Dendrothele bispora CBS 962.96]